MEQLEQRCHAPIGMISEAFLHFFRVLVDVPAGVQIEAEMIS
jgi:hypothetical protein